ncbi:hypothetical protein E2C01_045877 [Portunus trituberculatus]|uniref:Uncharacterized protein n=1 Tax=Portunus trituberculatus TaxID=210409 RepID=A0A5B7G366_PORTR|nr:hypothetical protein [Portunus trituberculatus]
MCSADCTSNVALNSNFGDKNENAGSELLAPAWDGPRPPAAAVLHSFSSWLPRPVSAAAAWALTDIRRKLCWQWRRWRRGE